MRKEKTERGIEQGGTLKYIILREYFISGLTYKYRFIFTNLYLPNLSLFIHDNYHSLIDITYHILIILHYIPSSYYEFENEWEGKCGW